METVADWFRNLASFEVRVLLPENYGRAKIGPRNTPRVALGGPIETGWFPRTIPFRPT